MHNLDLFAPQTHARNSDPSTSHLAAACIKDFAPTHCEVIFAALTKRGPMTADEIAAETGLLAHQANKRLSDMRRAAMNNVPSPKAIPTGEFRLSDAGRMERVWEAVPESR